MLIRLMFAACLILGIARCNRSKESAAPAPAPTVELSRASFAMFAGDDPVLCMDVTGTEAKFQHMLQVSPHTTRLKQSCDSLGVTELASCTTEAVTQHFYRSHEESTKMAACLKAGGQWHHSSSPDSDYQRAKQTLSVEDRHALP